MATKLEAQIDKALAVLNAQTRPRVHIVRPPRPRGGKKRAAGKGRAPSDNSAWVLGDHGNRWRERNGLTLTVVDTDRGWRWRVARSWKSRDRNDPGVAVLETGVLGDIDDALTAAERAADKIIAKRGGKTRSKRRPAGKGRAPLFEIGPYVLWRHRSDGWREVRSYSNEDSATYDADTIIGGGGRAKVTFHGERIYPRGTSRRGGKPRRRRARKSR